MSDESFAYAVAVQVCGHSQPPCEKCIAFGQRVAERAKEHSAASGELGKDQ